MVDVCPQCREVVHTSGGYIVSHGSRYHGTVIVCAGSGMRSYADCCSLNIDARD